MTVIISQVSLSVITGLWYYVEGNDRPCLTLIGSPNFGYRSVHRDIEAQIAIVTENDELQTQLQQVRIIHTYRHFGHYIKYHLCALCLIIL